MALCLAGGPLLGTASVLQELLSLEKYFCLRSCKYAELKVCLSNQISKLTRVQCSLATERRLVENPLCMVSVLENKLWINGGNFKCLL